MKLEIKDESDLEIIAEELENSSESTLVIIEHPNRLYLLIYKSYVLSGKVPKISGDHAYEFIKNQSPKIIPYASLYLLSDKNQIFFSGRDAIELLCNKYFNAVEQVHEVNEFIRKKAKDLEDVENA